MALVLCWQGFCCVLAICRIHSIDAIYEEVAFLMEYSYIVAMILIALALLTVWVISVGIMF